jgi:hypothetical protein
MFGIGSFELIIILIIMLLIWFVPGIIGAYIAGMKGRSKLGWFFICAIFPLCIIAIIFLPPAKEIAGKYKQCPACKEFVKWGAIICKHCRSEILC